MKLNNETIFNGWGDVITFSDDTHMRFESGGQRADFEFYPTFDGESVEYDMQCKGACCTFIQDLSGAEKIVEARLGALEKRITDNRTLKRGDAIEVYDNAFDVWSDAVFIGHVGISKDKSTGRSVVECVVAASIESYETSHEFFPILDIIRKAQQ